ncbi:prion-inhibition and propagation-domain-containing protein [Mycena epipterygia]|nr:prion-inhibition and propagation-domain-containing protein [Mycena epipterygia]
MPDPIAVIGLLGQCYSGAVQAYLFIQTAVEFPETAAKLVIQLEVERIRLQLWGRNSGADSDALYPGLTPFEPLIVDILTKIQQLLSDSDRLKAKYGLASRMDGIAGIRPRVPRNSGLLDHVKDVLRSALALSASDKGTKAGHMAHDAAHNRTLRRKGFDRLSWALVSKSRFESLIVDLRYFTNNLNELLRESQLLKLSQQWRSIEMQAVARFEDPRVLKALQEATDGDKNCREIFSMAKRKSIIVTNQDFDVSTFKPNILSKKDFDLPTNFYQMPRCIAVYRPRRRAASQSYALVERKTYKPEEKTQLLFRLHQLIELVNASPTQNLVCKGYWSEPRTNSWHLVYQIPSHGIALAPIKELVPSQPLSLRLLLSTSFRRPPLEARLTLACALAGSFSRFFGSKWLHKAIRSENIVFPASGGGYDIAHPIVVGFTESSRPANQATRHSDNERPRPPQAFLDSLTRETTIYHHPGYLNPIRETPYSMVFDIYSFGLVLAEIGWWLPLESFSGASQAGRRGETGGLRRKMIDQLKKDLAFRMGTPYKDVVEWCLTRDAGSDSSLAVEFYNKVVVPLWNISRWGDRLQ